MKRLKQCGAALIFFLFFQYAARGDFTWATVPTVLDPTNGGDLLDENGALLTGSDADSTVGCFVQLVRDVSGDGADVGVGALVAGGDGTGAASDDVVVAATWVGRGSVATATGVTDGWVPDEFFQSIAAGLPDDAMYYVRVWNAPSPDFNLANTALSKAPFAARLYVGVSSLFRDNYLEGGFPQTPGSFNFTFNNDVQTTIPITAPLAITSMVSGASAATVDVNWRSASGTAYLVQWADDLDFTTPSSAGPFTASSNDHGVTISLGSTQEFIRVIEQ